MMSAASVSPSIVRSSLEVMLDSIRLRDEQPKDLPPALPVRPTSRGRLPTSRRSMAVNLKLEKSAPEELLKELTKCNYEKEDEMPRSCKGVMFRSAILGSKKIGNVGRPEESPYFKITRPGSNSENVEVCDAESAAITLSTAVSMQNKLGKGDGIECSLKKCIIRGASTNKSNSFWRLLIHISQNQQVWCWIPDARWELGEVQQVSGDDVDILLSAGNVLSVSWENLLPANPRVLDGVGDLMQLSYLNEPSVIQNFKYRYSRDLIYTKAGPILVAINPFKEVPLYEEKIVRAYKQKLIDIPHVFAIADTAFNEMMRDGVNQSIIISGESGAGKTETAKFAMRYIADLGGGSGIENEVLQTNSILEAFGNAKTLRNDNSSRFGKLIEINFTSVGKICGAKIQTFLLEKSRVVQRATGERSYHIFYLLCAGAARDLKEDLNLKAAHEYEYLKRSNCLTIDNVDDALRFRILVEALDVLHMSKKGQKNLFSMLAAVLWLGNISFSLIDNENHVEVIFSEGVINTAKLMGWEVPDLMLALSTRKIQAGNDSIIQKLTLQQAIDTRDALAKSIYASLFDWLVEQINKSLEVETCCAGRSISILDIFGFESFHQNGFEQFCINYANERLQQHFNRHLFKLEQEDYAKEGIDWTNIDFVDNTDCLSLFEKKPLGLISLLDEESTFPKATDLTFAEKLKQHLAGSYSFKGEMGCGFRISHYAGEVLYDSTGFLEKNRDTLHVDLVQLLVSCAHHLPKSFSSNILHSDKELSYFWQPNYVDNRKQSVMTKFKGQLFKLIHQLESTAPHFIRCIKPNNKQLPDLYEYDLVLQQLRWCGVLEVVRISRSGYPTRISHQLFAERYGFLLESSGYHDALSLSVAILQQFSMPPEMYRVGYTKLFFRTGQIAVLENSRNRILQGIICVQKNFRTVQVRHFYQQMRIGATTLQSFIRGCLARKQFLDLKMKEMSKVRLMQVHKSSEINLRQPMKDITNELSQIHPTVIDELHRRALKAEAALKEKEEENAILQQRLKQYDARWSVYELKMKSMEHTWHKQLTSLQSSLAAARKSLLPDCICQPGRLEMAIVNHIYDSEDTVSAGTQTPEETPTKQSTDAEVLRIDDSKSIAVINLVKEFDKQRQVFEDDAGFILEVKSGQSSSKMDPEEELQKLKARFTTWKKAYKLCLRKTKTALQKYDNSEEKISKKWWSMRNTK